MKEDKIQELIKLCSPCIIVTPRYNYDNQNRRYCDGLTVLGESSKHLGHSYGVGTRYDYGFMQLDTEGSNITVIILK